MSVIIPVHNDAQRLGTCLAALEQQTYPAHRYDIIVVDNGSEDEAALANVIAASSHASTVKEATPGSYAARNRGIALAKGEILAFTDADCIPAADWLEKGVKYLQANPQRGLVAGRIEMFFVDPDHVTAAALYDQVVMGFPQQEFLETCRGAMTANIFTRRAVVETVGTFRTTLKSHSDLEWGARVYGAGYDQIYAEDAWVAHPARNSIQSLWQRTRRLSGGVYQVFYIEPDLSTWSRHKRFIKLVLDDLWKNNLSFSRRALGDDRLDAWSIRGRVLIIVWLMQGVSALEKIRLRLGGQTQR